MVVLQNSAILSISSQTADPKKYQPRTSVGTALPVFLGSTGNFLPPLWCCGGSVAILSDSLILAKKEDFTITLWIGSKFTSGTLKDKLFICFLFLRPLHVRGQGFLLCSSGTIETELSNANTLLPSTAHFYPTELSRACSGLQ